MSSRPPSGLLANLSFQGTARKLRLRVPSGGP